MMDIIKLWWPVLFSIIAGVAGQTVLKVGVSQASGAAQKFSLLTPIHLLLASPWTVVGVLLYGAGALSWMVVLSRFDLSQAYPFLALNFILIALVSHFTLGEPMPVARWVGIGVICIGIMLIAGSEIP